MFSAGRRQRTHFHGTELNSPVCVNFKRKKKVPRILSRCWSLMTGVLRSGLSCCGAVACLFPTRWLPRRVSVRLRLACVCVGWTVPHRVAFESAVPRPRHQRLGNPDPLHFSTFVVMEAGVTAGVSSLWKDDLVCGEWASPAPVPSSSMAQQPGQAPGPRPGAHVAASQGRLPGRSPSPAFPHSL